MDGKPLVSIIVPVYNIEKYVGNCLESLIKQTYKNIEIIVIDDNSTDKSLSICQKFEKKDPRVKVISNKKNKGISAVRTKGINESLGDFVMYVDGDDWIDVDCIEKCIGNMRDDVDVIFFPFRKEFDGHTVDVKLFDNECVFTNKDTKNDLLRKFFGPFGNEMKNPIRMDNISAVWGKMYRKIIVDGYSFMDINVVGNEDGLANIYFLHNARKVKYIESTWYHYRKNNEASLTRSYDDKTFDRWERLYIEMDKCISDFDLDETYKESLNNKRIINLLTGSLSITSSRMSVREKRAKIKQALDDENIRKSFKKFNMRYLSTIWKLYYGMCKRRMVRGIYYFDSMIIFYKKLKWGAK